MSALLLRTTTGEMMPLRSGKVELKTLEGRGAYVLGGELIYPPEKSVMEHFSGDLPDGTVVDWSPTGFLLSVDAAQPL
jgi:hypothetical protein